MTVSTVVEAIKSLENGFDAFAEIHNDKTAELQDRLEILEARKDAPPLTGVSEKKVVNYRTLHTPSGEKAYVVGGNARLSDIPELRGAKAAPPVSIDRWANALIFGDNCGDKEAKEFLGEQKSVSTGSTGVLLPEGFVSEWIDMARAQSVLMRAGAQTVTMPQQTLAYAHQTGDPTFAWRASEGASLSATDPVFASRILTAKTVAVRTQVSLEATQDIPSFGQQIAAAYTKAFGAAIDEAGIKGTSPGPVGLHTAAGVTEQDTTGALTNWDKVLDGVAAYLGANNRLEDLSAFITHPLVWKVLSKLKTGIASDNTPLMLPSAIANVPLLPTTNGVNTTFLMGNFRDLVMGVRMNPTIRILDSTSSMASNLLVEIVGVARIDFLPLRPASFVRLTGITGAT